MPSAHLRVPRKLVDFALWFGTRFRNVIFARFQFNWAHRVSPRYKVQLARDQSCKQLTTYTVKRPIQLPLIDRCSSIESCHCQMVHATRYANKNMATCKILEHNAIETKRMCSKMVTTKTHGVCHHVSSICFLW